MDWTEITVTVPSENIETAGNIAQMTVPYGIYIEDYSDLEQEVLEIANIDLIDEELLKKDREHGIIHIYISPEENPAEAVSFIRERLDAEDIPCEISSGSCDVESCLVNWRKYFKPIPVGEKILIRPVWRDDYDADGRVVLNLEPGLAFGTGTHETTRLCLEALEKHGIKSNYVSMDDYFLGVSEGVTPKTPEGEFDLESPLCLDIEMLNDHFSRLSAGGEVAVPAYDFTAQKRSDGISKTVRLDKDEVAVFEGIHALNPMFTQKHPEAFKLYISARSDVVFRDTIVFKRTWFRLTRRLVRDYNFRGASPEYTMNMWANVRRGETTYISPYKNTADFQFDTSLPYELAVYNETATKLFSNIPEGIERYEELRKVLPALQLFGTIDQSMVPENALVREFIGKKTINWDDLY